VKAAGVNLFDTQLRSGLYKRDLPLTLGLEGAGGFFKADLVGQWHDALCGHERIVVTYIRPHLATAK
jgi:hypothetical protein